MKTAKTKPMVFRGPDTIPGTTFMVVSCGSSMSLVFPAEMDVRNTALAMAAFVGTIHRKKLKPPFVYTCGVESNPSGQLNAVSLAIKGSFAPVADAAIGRIRKKARP